MPYVKPACRERLEPVLEALKSSGEFTIGDLNYLFTRMAGLYVERWGKSYSTLNEVIGVFEAAKMEFYRRRVAPYEDTKIQENGDV